MLKLMDLFVILDRVKAGPAPRRDVPVTKEAYEMGGCRCGSIARSFPLVLYALMVQSANDAAIALAQHVGGSRRVSCADEREGARWICRPSRSFSRPWPAAGKGQRPDIYAARFRQALPGSACRASRHPEIPQYPAAPVPTRNTHHGKPQRIARDLPGCDELKTG